MNHIVYNAVDPEVVEEFKCIENMGSKATLLAGTTRLTYCVITKEISGDYYFYFYTY